MTLSSDPRPQEFGAELARTRDASGVSLDEIAERTKISRRLLEALESGDFAKLPGRAFARMFLKQYLAIIGERPQPWLETFEGAWRRHQEASASFPSIPAVPTERRRVVPWIGGVLLVVVAFVAVLAVVRRSTETDSLPVATVIPATTHTPVASAVVTAAPAATPAPTSPAAAGDLVVTALDRECWVEIEVPGEPARSRLLAAGERWASEIGAAGADLTVGDAGAVEVTVGGRRVEVPGGPGRVAHLRVRPGTAGADPSPDRGGDIVGGDGE